MKDQDEDIIHENPDLDLTFIEYILQQPVDIDFTYIKNNETIEETVYAKVDIFDDLRHYYYKLEEYRKYCEADPETCWEIESDIEGTITSLDIPFYLESRVNYETRKKEIVYYNYYKKTISYHLNKWELQYLSENLKSEIEIWLQELGFVVKEHLDYELYEMFKAIERKKRRNALIRAKKTKKQSS